MVMSDRFHNGGRPLNPLPIAVPISKERRLERVMDPNDRFYPLIFTHSLLIAGPLSMVNF
jgi:hypothetical protein